MAHQRLEQKLHELTKRGLVKNPLDSQPETNNQAKSGAKARSQSADIHNSSSKPVYVDLYPPLPPHEPFRYNLNWHPGGGYDFPGAAIGKGGSIVRKIRQGTGTKVTVCDELGALDGRRPPADADVYVRIAANESTDEGLTAVRKASDWVAELWKPTNAAFKPFTVKFGVSLRLEPDWDQLEASDYQDYIQSCEADNSSVQGSEATAPPPPPPPKPVSVLSSVGSERSSPKHHTESTLTTPQTSPQHAQAGYQWSQGAEQPTVGVQQQSTKNGFREYGTADAQDHYNYHSHPEYHGLGTSLSATWSALGSPEAGHLSWGQLDLGSQQLNGFYGSQVVSSGLNSYTSLHSGDILQAPQEADPALAWLADLHSEEQRHRQEASHNLASPVQKQDAEVEVSNLLTLLTCN